MSNNCPLWMGRRCALNWNEFFLSAPFRNSKRYPAFLRYVVEQELNGASSELKERTIAIEVFGKDPYYDPAVDPVVRISAGEVRKRLAQYYQEFC